MTNEVRQISRIFLSSVFLFFGLLIPQDSCSIELKQRQFGAGLQTSDAAGGFVATEVPGTEGMSEMEVISTLRHDIQLLDEEIMKCDRKRKGWVAATVVGGVGVVGTGVAALVQHGNIQEKKTELGRVKGEVEGTNASIKSAQKELDNM